MNILYPNVYSEECNSTDVMNSGTTQTLECGQLSYSAHCNDDLTVARCRLSRQPNTSVPWSTLKRRQRYPSAVSTMSWRWPHCRLQASTEPLPTLCRLPVSATTTPHSIGSTLSFGTSASLASQTPGPTSGRRLLKAVL